MSRFTIVSHNAGWFAGTPMASDDPGEPNAKIVARLAEVYRGLSPDALCLQQVQSAEAFGAIQDALGMVGTYCPGGAFPQYGGAVFWRDAIGAPVCESGSLDPPAQHMWQIVQLYGASGCVSVANIQLPASRQLGHRSAARLRIVEMAHLLHHIPRPAILVGDLNEQPNGVLGTHLGRQGFVDAGQLGGQPFYPTCLSGGRGDQIWTDVMHGVHLVRYGMASVSELDCHLPEVSYLADHLPVWAQIEL